MGWVVTADSVPVYDEWGWADYWGCGEWMDWYTALYNKFGEQQAQSTWINAWLDGVNLFGHSVPEDCRTFNTSFKEFLADKPLMHDAVYDGVTGKVAEFLSGTVSVGEYVGEAIKKSFENLGDTITNITDATKSTSSVLVWAIPAALGLLLIIGVTYAYSETKKVAA